MNDSTEARSTTKVLVVGLRGVGAEVATHLVLSGVHTLTVLDCEPTQIRDLGSNPLLETNDVGLPRGDVCSRKLEGLRAHVRVKSALGLTEALVCAHTAVVFTRGSKEELIRWNEFCRTQSPQIAFISCYTGGVVGSVFVDFGDDHVVLDADGRKPLVKLIDKVEELVDQETGKYTLLHYITPDGQDPRQLEDSGLVQLSDVKGLVSPVFGSLNSIPSIHGKGIVRTQHRKGDPPNTVRIYEEIASAIAGDGGPVRKAIAGDGGPVRKAIAGDGGPVRKAIAGLSQWEGEGAVTERKEARKVKFRTLAECCVQPGSVGSEGGVVLVDMSFSQTELHIHVALQALYAFQEKHGRFPLPGDELETDQVVELAYEFEETAKVLAGAQLTLDEDVTRRVARHASIELPPMCVVLGGVIAQETLKTTGRFQPIHQWLNLEFFSALPTQPPVDATPEDCRYDDIVAVYGKSFQEMLGNLKVFMVGCGVLGREIMKNLSLSGVCCGPNGCLTVTDNDHYKVTQHKHSRGTVGQPKSMAAANYGHTINSSLNIDVRETLRYLDQRCTFFKKPLLGASTRNTAGSIDVVVPGLTRSIADGGAHEEVTPSAPLSTLYGFPQVVEHCCEWARLQFEDLFVFPALKAQELADDPNAFLTTTRRTTLDLPPGSERRLAVERGVDSLLLLKSAMADAVSQLGVEDCVELAWRAFHRMFRDKILDLVSIYPEDVVTQSGERFWFGGSRKFPVAVTFDPSDPDHVGFIISATRLFARLCKAHGTLEERTVLSVLSKLPSTQHTQEKDASEAESKLEELLLSLTSLAPNVQGKGGVEHMVFDVADDDNFHLDFVTAACNLRSLNYRFSRLSREQCRQYLSGKSPTTTTTVATVSGLLMLELLKVLQGKARETYKSGCVDLATNAFILFETQPPFG